jgi:DNA-directed RNA polymerase subunit RPC12/RpoP
MTDQVFAATEDHPAACPWCGRSRIRGILPSPDGNRWYRCVACATTFFLTSHVPDRDGGGTTDERASTRTP